jgi:hypothetical protein
MSIAHTTSVAANTATAGSLALAGLTVAAGDSMAVGVIMDNTSATVTSVTDTKGNTYTQKTALNGTGLRMEIWTCLNSGLQAGDIITVNVSPNCNFAIAGAKYSGVSSYGNVGSNSGTGTTTWSTVALQDDTNFGVFFLGFAAQSGDTVSARTGTQRVTSIPAATRPGIVLSDVSSLAPSSSVPQSSLISNSRNWVQAAIELRSGVTGKALTAQPAANSAAEATFDATSPTTGYLGGKAPAPTQLPIEGQLFPPSFPPSSNTFF